MEFMKELTNGYLDMQPFQTLTPHGFENLITASCVKQGEV